MVQRYGSKKTPHLRSHVARKALQFAKDLGKHNNIAFYFKSGEKAGVDIAEDWKQNFQPF